MTATKKTGRQAKSYYNTGSHASPVWVEMKRIVNLTQPFSKGEAELKDRESDFAKVLGGLKTIGLKFTYHERHSTNDTVFAALWDSWFNDTAVEFAAMNGAINVAGNKGYRAFLMVTEMERGEELEGVIEWDVTLKLTEHEEAGATVEPDRYTVP
jgi:asparagine synthetase A